jgi:CheY-like chemotaxis protein/HPt (histidine-containing phosphotransfer) domain-containing protein
MSGIKFGQVIQADSRWSDLILILMCSLASPSDVRTSDGTGFASVLTKPIRRSELYDCLATALAGGHSPTPIPETAHVLPTEKLHPHARILLAEDNITNQQVALGILSRLGLSADAVANGREALQALTDLPYDLVLMDVQMPGLDGLEAARQIRDPASSVRDHDIPIIAMTAHAMAKDRETCLLAGMNDYISKPVSVQALAAALDKWLPLEVAHPRVMLTQLSKIPPAPMNGVPGASLVPVYDHAALLSRVMGDEATLVTIQEIFLSDIPRLLETLVDAVARADAETTANLAHTIKGAAANVGGEALRLAAAALEDAARKNAVDTMSTLLSDLQGQFQRLRAAMTEGDRPCAS